MALNRVESSVEDVLIASIAERAVQHHSGSFDAAMGEVLCAGFEAIKAAETVSAAMEAEAAH